MSEFEQAREDLRKAWEDFKKDCRETAPASCVYKALEAAAEWLNSKLKQAMATKQNAPEP